jgi:hypothetical protein
MRDLPDIAQLLDLAEDGADALAARCRAIAEREREEGRAPYAAIEADIANLLDLPVAPDLLNHLARAIRRGRFDQPGPERARLDALLYRHAVQRLRETYPEFIF